MPRQPASTKRVRQHKQRKARIQIGNRFHKFNNGKTLHGHNEFGTEHSAPTTGTLRAWKGKVRSERRNAARKAARHWPEASEETEVENSVAGVSGKVQNQTAGAGVKSWFCDGLETGVAGTGCDSGEGVATQHALPQWQAWATRTTPAACAGVRTRVSSQQQAANNGQYRFHVSNINPSIKEAQPLLASSCQFLAWLSAYGGSSSYWAGQASQPLRPPTAMGERLMCQFCTVIRAWS